MTTDQGYTPMRGLVMDFRTDGRAADTGDEFMFGPAFLVPPVTEPAADSRRVYLPGGRWYDFWTGKTLNGGRSIDAAAPLERLPLFVRGGSIVPLGPGMEWTREKSSDTMEIRVYRGASGTFTLYEDEGDNYDYEKGSYSLIPFTWDEQSGRLTIGTRRGEYPGMNPTRTFRLVFVKTGHGTGGGETPRPDVVARYRGSTLTITPR
jgi:alpha-D-xyloside xylohydrolase